MRAERERSKTEMKDLQLQLSEMHDELDQAKRAEVVNAEKEDLLKVNQNHMTTSCEISRSGIPTLHSVGCPAGYGAAASGRSGDAAGAGGAAGTAAPQGARAPCPKGGSQRGGGDS